MNILITGACGQLGRALRDISRGYDHKCIFADVVDDDDVMYLDVTDASAVLDVMRTYAVDVVVNCDFAPRILADASREMNAVFIHVSEDYVYEGASNVPYREIDMPACGRSDDEAAVEESGCRYVIIRTSWLYSCYGDNSFRVFEDRTSRCPSMDVPMDMTGTPTYAYDLAQTIFWIVDDGKMDNTGIYNYSDEGSCSLYDFAVAVNRMFGYTCDVRPCRTDESVHDVRPAYSVMDKSLFKRTFGYRIPHWEDSLRLCTEEYRRIINK